MQVFVYDPTQKDSQSKVRGIGRYLQLLRENFEGKFIFTDKLPITNPQSPITFINPFFNFLAPPLTMRRIAQKQIAVIHDLIPLKYPDHFPVGLVGLKNVLLNKFALRNYDHIITDSETSKRDIVSLLKIKSERIFVVYPCLPKIFTEPYQPLTNSQSPVVNYCLYVGDATWNKNLVNIAKAVLIAQTPCMFVGKIFDKKDEILNHPWQKELREFFILAKKNPLFILKGFVPDNELINLYKQASLNILISRDEGFGFSYVEAGSQECPSLLADRPICHEIAQDGACFTSPEQPEEIARLIKEFTADPQNRASIGYKAYQRSLFFSQEQFKKGIVLAVEG